MYEPDLTAPIWALELIAVLGRVIDFERDQIESVKGNNLERRSKWSPKMLRPLAPRLNLTLLAETWTKAGH